MYTCEPVPTVRVVNPILLFRVAWSLLYRFLPFRLLVLLSGVWVFFLVGVSQSVSRRVVGVPRWWIAWIVFVCPGLLFVLFVLPVRLGCALYARFGCSFWPFAFTARFGSGFPVHEQAYRWRSEVVVRLGRVRLSRNSMPLPLGVPVLGRTLSSKPSLVSYSVPTVYDDVTHPR